MFDTPTRTPHPPLFIFDFHKILADFMVNMRSALAALTRAW